MILTKEISAKIAALRNDTTSGATALARFAGEILVRVTEIFARVPNAELRSRIIAAGKAVIAAQPAMATIYCLVNDVLGALGDGAGGPGLAGRVQDRARAYLAGLDRAQEAAAARGASLVDEGSLIVTHSRSSLVEKALLAARSAGKAFSVVCTESRPGGEGCSLAEALGMRGITTTLVADAAIGSFISRGARVMVGSDALSVHGLVNKIGTRMIAQAAQHAGVQVYVVATTHRFLPPTVPLLTQGLKNPGQTASGRRLPYTVVNLTFDRTPLESVTACVAEHTILDQQTLIEVLGSWRVERTLDLESCG